jgi:hypothetical protein
MSVLDPRQRQAIRLGVGVLVRAGLSPVDPGEPHPARNALAVHDQRLRAGGRVAVGVKQRLRIGGRRGRQAVELLRKALPGSGLCSSAPS